MNLKYRTMYVEQAAKLCRLGATSAQLGDFFGVDRRTIQDWMDAHPAFGAAVREAKNEADNAVEQSLYRRALGYSHDAVKILQYEGAPVVVPYVEHYPPDTTACIFWLKNRQSDNWRDVNRIEHSGTVTLAEQTVQRLNDGRKRLQLVR